MKKFMTIGLGTGSLSCGNFPAEFEEEGIVLDDSAMQILSTQEFFESIYPETRKVDLFMATTANLTGCRYASTKTIFNAIHGSGFCLCPAEMGPQLRIQYPGEENILIAMDAIKEKIFSICCPHLHQPTLSSVRGASMRTWKGDTKWAFMRH